MQLAPLAEVYASRVEEISDDRNCLLIFLSPVIAKEARVPSHEGWYWPLEAGGGGGGGMETISAL